MAVPKRPFLKALVASTAAQILQQGNWRRVLHYADVKRVWVEDHLQSDGVIVIHVVQDGDQPLERIYEFKMPVEVTGRR